MCFAYLKINLVWIDTQYTFTHTWLKSTYVGGRYSVFLPGFKFDKEGSSKSVIILLTRRHNPRLFQVINWTSGCVQWPQSLRVQAYYFQCSWKNPSSSSSLDFSKHIIFNPNSSALSGPQSLLRCGWLGSFSNSENLSPKSSANLFLWYCVLVAWKLSCQLCQQFAPPVDLTSCPFYAFLIHQCCNACLALLDDVFFVG